MIVEIPLLKVLPIILIRQFGNGIFTARWSGDKFMILLPETEIDGVEIIQNKINKYFDETKFDFKGMQHSVEVSYSFKVCNGNDELDLILKEIE